MIFEWFAIVALVAVTFFLLVGLGEFTMWFWSQVF